MPIINSSNGLEFNSIAELKATTIQPKENDNVNVVEGNVKRIYNYEPNSVLAGDDDSVVELNNFGGRFIKIADGNTDSYVTVLNLTYTQLGLVNGSTLTQVKQAIATYLEGYNKNEDETLVVTLGEPNFNVDFVQSGGNVISREKDLNIINFELDFFPNVTSPIDAITGEITFHRRGDVIQFVADVILTNPALVNQRIYIITNLNNINENLRALNYITYMGEGGSRCMVGQGQMSVWFPSAYTSYRISGTYIAE